MLLRDLIIEQVYAYPALYDMSHKEYLNNIKKLEIYDNIAKTINDSYTELRLNGGDVKDIWLKLLDLYKEHKNKNHYIPSGSGARMPSSPEMEDLFEKLSFLDQRVGHRPTQSSISAMQRGSIWSRQKDNRSVVPVVPEPHICHRTKRANMDDQLKGEVKELINSVKDCATAVTNNIKNKNELADKYYKEVLVNYFNKIENENDREQLMALMLAGINKYKN